MNTFRRLKSKLFKLVFLLIIVLPCFFALHYTARAQNSGYRVGSVSEIVDLLNSNRLLDARKRAEALTSSNSSDHSLYYMLGFVNYHSKDYDGARRSLSKAISLNRKKGDAYYYRALAYIALNKPEKALNDLNTALKDGNTPLQLHNLATILRSKTRLNEWQGNIYHFRAIAYKLLGRYPEGINDINRAIELYGKMSPYSVMIRGGLKYLMHDYSEAYNDYQNAIKLGFPGVVPKYHLALIEFFFGKYQDAINHLKEVIEFDPEYPNANLELGMMYLLSGDIAKAESILKNEYRKNQSAYSALQLAFLYHLQDKQGKAARLFSKALELDSRCLQVIKFKHDLIPESSPTKGKIQLMIQAAEYYLGITGKAGSEETRNREPVFGITHILFNPNPVRMNSEFTITIEITADIIGEKINIPTHFFFTISQGDDILFTSEQRKISIINGQSGEWTENMEAVPATGNFTLNVYAKHNDKIAEDHVEFTIQ